MFAGADQIEVFALDLIHHGVHVRLAHDALHHVPVDHKRRDVIPNIIDPSVPIGPDDSANVELERFGEPVIPEFDPAWRGPFSPVP